MTNGLHGNIVEVINRGGHGMHGVFAAIGDYEIKPERTSATVFDVVPTVLEYLDLPLPEVCDGVPLFKKVSKKNYKRFRYLSLFRKLRLKAWTVI